MHKVLAHIDEHLDRQVPLEELADVAHFSAFHFHRVFAAWAGETLGDYQRRRRLEVAALRLATRRAASVLDVAVSVGFGSAEAFSRAFRAHFGSPPSVWRRRHDWTAEHAERLRRSNPDQILAHGFEKNRASARNEETPLKVELITRPPVTVAYLRHIGPYGAPIGAFWNERVAPWITAHQLWSRPRYGISHDDPSLTPPEQSRYDACIEVAEDFVPDGGFQLTQLPGGRYASLPFYGRSAQINEAWTQLIGDWLPSSGFQFDHRPAFEHYPPHGASNPDTGEFTCDICIPVAPL